MIRYELKRGKFGYYFYDSEMNIDLSLETVLNRLNDTKEQLDKLRKQYSKLNITYLTIERKLKSLFIDDVE